jgi:glycosyltransferase involved in cell wall biosynthesis
LKLLFISEYFPSNSKLDFTGGVEVRNYYITKNLAKKHVVQVITSKLSTRFSSQVLDNINVFYVGHPRDYSRTNKIDRIIFMINAIRQGLHVDFDLVEGAGLWSWLPAYILSIIKRRKKTILIADTVNNYGKNISLFNLTLLKLMEKFLLTLHWDRIICISKTVQDNLIKQGIKKDNISIVYCGVDLQLIKNIGIRKSSFPTISCVARLVPYKRVIDLIEAIIILKKQYSSIQLHIVGKGEELNKLQSKVKDRQMTKNIHFHQFIPSYINVIKIIKSSHIFCLPSVVEGFGIVNIEALACQVPAILADIPVNHETTQNKGVLFFQPYNSIDLAAKIKFLIENKKLYNNLKKDTGFVISQYNWSTISQITERIYENLCHN